MARFQVSQGWRFPATKSIAELCRQLDAECEPLQLRLATDAIAYVAGSVLEARTVSEEQAWHKWKFEVGFGTAQQVKPESIHLHRNNFLLQCISFVHETQLALGRRNAYRIDLSLDIEMKVTFHSDPDDPEWTYARVLTDRDELRDLWKRVSGAQNYKWWAGQDPDDLPGGLTTEEWERREVVWNRILGTKPMRHSSLMWKLSEETYFDLLMQDEQTGITKEAVANSVLSWNKPLEYRQEIHDLILKGMDGPAIKPPVTES
jgi:hypothetical protein